MSIEQDMGRVIDRIIIYADEDDKNTSESSVRCYDDDDLQANGLVSCDE